MENIYVVFDKKLGASDYVFTAVSDSCAVRVFDGFLAQSGTNIANCPEDFDLFSIGSIDMATCAISTYDRKFVCNALDRQLLIQALQERRRLKLEAFLGSLPSGSAVSGAVSGAASGSAASGSAAGSVVVSSESRMTGIGSDSSVVESHSDRVASVFGLSRETDPLPESNNLLFDHKPSDSFSAEKKELN